MTPIKRISAAAAGRLVGMKHYNTFKKWADFVGLKEYPKIGTKYKTMKDGTLAKYNPVEYDEAEVIRKYNMPAEEIEAAQEPKQRKRRGQIAA